MEETACEVVQPIMDRVDALAAQLGTTTEYLWPTYVAREQLFGYMGFTALVILTFVCAAGIILSARQWKKTNNAEWIPGLVVPAIIWTGAAIIIFCTSTPRILTPEPYALVKITYAVGQITGK